MNSDSIIKIAKRYVGLTESVPNAKWTSKTIANCDVLSDQLSKNMIAASWRSGWPYCMAFVKAVYMEAFAKDPAKLAFIKKAFTPAVMTSYNASKAYVSKIPTPGSVFIFQKGAGGNGHAGIVVEVSDHSFSTIEGNTSPAAKTVEQDREGDGIFSKARKLDFTSSAGLHLIGFIDLL
jgi:hypothetical protein